MPPAPFPPNEPARLCALHECGILDTKPDPEFDALTRLACRLCDMPIAYVSLVDDDRQWFKSKVGSTTTETPRDWAICAYAILSDEPLIIPDTTKDARTADSPLVTGDAGVRFYAGIPLRTHDGLTLGSFCVTDTRPRELSQEQLDLLTTLGTQVTALLELRRLRQREAAPHDLNADLQHKVDGVLARMRLESSRALTSLRGGIDALSELGAVTPNAAPFVQLLQSGADAIDELLHDQEEFWLLEFGRFPSRPSPVRLCEELRHVAHNLSPRRGDAPHPIEVTIHPPTPDQVYLNPVLLRALLTRMIRHANAATNLPITIHVESSPALTLLRSVVQISLRYRMPNAAPAPSARDTFNFTIAQQLANLLGSELSLEVSADSDCFLHFSVIALVGQSDSSEHPLPAAA